MIVPIDMPLNWRQEAQMRMIRPRVSPSELLDAQLVGIGRNRSRRQAWEKKLEAAGSKDLPEVLMRVIGSRQDPTKNVTRKPVRKQLTRHAPGLPRMKMSENQGMSPTLASVLGGVGAGAVGAGAGGGIAALLQRLQGASDLPTTVEPSSLFESQQLRQAQQQVGDAEFARNFINRSDDQTFFGDPTTTPFERARRRALKNKKDELLADPGKMMSFAEPGERDFMRNLDPMNLTAGEEKRLSALERQLSQRAADADPKFNTMFNRPQQLSDKLPELRKNLDTLTDSLLGRTGASNTTEALGDLASMATEENVIGNMLNRGRRRLGIGAAALGGGALAGLIGAHLASAKAQRNRINRTYGFDDANVAKLSKVRDAQFVAFEGDGEPLQQIYMERRSPNLRDRGIRALGSGALGGAAGAGIGRLLGNTRRGGGVGAILGALGGVVAPTGVTRAWDTDTGDAVTGINRRRARFLANVLDAGERPGNQATVGFDPGTMEQSQRYGRRLGFDSPVRAAVMDVDDTIRENPGMRASLLR